MWNMMDGLVERSCRLGCLKVEMKRFLTRNQVLTCSLLLDFIGNRSHLTSTNDHLPKWPFTHDVHDLEGRGGGGVAVLCDRGLKSPNFCGRH